MTRRPAYVGASPAGSAYGHDPTACLTAAAVAERAPFASRLAFAAVRALSGAAIAAGALLALAGAIGLDVPAAAVCALALAGAAAVAGAALHPRGPLVAAAALAVIFIACVLAAGGQFAESARALWTAFAFAAADASSWRLPELALADPEHAAETAARALCALAVPAGALASALAGLRARWWVVLLVPVPLALSLAFGLAVPAAPCVLEAVGATAVFGAGVLSAPGTPATGQGGPMRAAAAALCAVCALAGAGALVLVEPPSAWQQPQPLAALRAAAGAAIHDARYGVQPNALPDGDFANLGAWRADDAVALVIEPAGGATAATAASAATAAPATAIQPMYLRGFVGSVHAADGWHALDQADYHAADALFWWLAEDGFQPQTQLADAYAAAQADGEAARQLKEQRTTGAEDPAGTAVDAQVRNTGASSEWLYLPYGLSAPADGIACEDRAGETAAPRGLAGARSYAFTCETGLLTSYPDVAALSWIARDADAAYWRAESNYNAFAYDAYAHNTEADEAAVSQVLGTMAADEGKHVDYAAAATAIIDWLDQNVTYDESYGAPEGAGGILADVLTGAKRGWSVHYATAAVAMLRHYGIPARYVEGYLVEPSAIAQVQKQAKAQAAGSTFDAAASAAVEVPASAGHAWAEMYVDGAGWVPLETVPAVRALMPQPDWARGIQADGTQRATVPPEQQQTVRDVETDAVEVVRQVLAGVGRALLVLLILFDIFALVFFLVSLVRRLLARRRRRIAFANPDDAAAVRAMAAWMAAVARFRFPKIPAGDNRRLQAAVRDAYGEEAAEAWGEAQAAGRKAAFSEHGSTADERASVRAAADGFAATVARSEGAWRRWMMRYLERLM